MDVEQKNKIEAVLYTTGREMTVDEISEMSGIGSKGFIKTALEELKKEHDSRMGGIHLIDNNGKWKLGIKKEYLSVTESLLTNTEMDEPIQKTLAMIAFKNPTLQSDIIKARGNKAYDHISFLKEQEFLVAEKHGRSRLLKLTPKFFEYFDVVEEELKEQLKKVVDGKGDVKNVEGLKLLFPK